METGDKVSFIHEGSDPRKFGVIVEINGDDITVDVDGEEFELSVRLDEVKLEGKA